MKIQNERNIWIDNVKVFACVLVVLGHFFQSMVKSGILPEEGFFKWFDRMIYYFHVPLFFICSGYLYQKYSVVNSFQTWSRNIRKKIIVLGIPYITFSTATWLLKSVFSGAVNGPIGGLVTTLLLSPTAPYWYLYTLFFIFMVTPTFSSKTKMILWLVIALNAKKLDICDIYTGNYMVDTVCAYEVWFIIGMCIAFCAIDIKLQRKTRIILGSTLMAVFLVLSICIYVYQVFFGGIYFLMGLLACTAVLITMHAVFQQNKQNKIFAFLFRYTMPIFLMHTIFTAPVRIVLLKLGIQSAIVHIVLGLFASFTGPIVAATVMGKFKCLDVLLNPSRYIKFRDGVNTHV